MQRFRDTRVLLTGAGSGIGRATALRLVAEGASVFGVDRDAEGLAGTSSAVAELEQEGRGRIATGVVDVTDEAGVIACVAAAAAELGGIDVLVNVAGMHRTTPIAELTVDDLRTLFDVNLVGTALFCREVVPHLRDKVGVIVNVASVAGSHGNPYMTAYAASKGAVLGFTQSLAAELVGRGIRVVSISPGSIDTPLTQNVQFGDLDFTYFMRILPQLDTGQPEKVAGTIAYAASSDAAYLTGVDLRVDGGAHI
ncbi:SDR family NAD(P)-dependent oxidoreductase [Nocardioides pacificus]